MARALREGAEHNGCEIALERPDGSRWVALAHANPFFDDAGRVVGAVNVLIDITERSSAEAAIREADRRKSEFLALLSHELRNPLAPLRNGLQVIRLAGQDRAVVEQASALMERQLTHLVRLIDDLLDLSRILKGKFELRRERLDLTAAVRDAVEMCRPMIEKYRHQLTLTLPPRPVWVDGDRARLAQVFINLLTNACKFTPAGGQVALTVEVQGSDVVVRVRDNGIGIAPDLQPTLFEMFTQGPSSREQAEGGLGIGLNLVRGILERHGGRVEAHSEGPGQGSVFLVRLPVLLSRGGEDRKEEGTKDTRGASHRVLIVDDNEDSAVSMALMLKILGHEVATARDGLHALAEAERFGPQVVLLDIGLPRLDGYEVCRRLRARPGGQQLVIIAQTGWGQEEDKLRSRAAGFNFHLIKPLDPQELERLLAGLLLAPA